jgi:hypothetical protein
MTATTTITTTIISGHPKPRFRHPTTLVHPPHTISSGNARTSNGTCVSAPVFNAPDLFRHPTARFRHPRTPLSTPRTPFATPQLRFRHPTPLSTPQDTQTQFRHPTTRVTPRHVYPPHTIPSRNARTSNRTCFPLFSHLRRVYEQRTHISFLFP